MDRLEHDAKTDMDVRREYARELTRRGDVRGALLDFSIEPDTDDCFKIQYLIEGNAALTYWLLSYLKHWTSLDLSNTQITCLKPLADHSDLQVLFLSYNEQIQDLGPLSDLDKLQEIRLVNTQVCDLTPLTKLINLERLSLIGTPVKDLTPLAGLVNLQWLHIEDTQVTDLSPLKDLSNLQGLRLGWTQVRDLSPLKSLTNLKSLDLGSTQVTDLSPIQHLIDAGLVVVGP